VWRSVGNNGIPAGRRCLSTGCSSSTHPSARTCSRQHSSAPRRWTSALCVVQDVHSMEWSLSTGWRIPLCESPLSAHPIDNRITSRELEKYDGPVLTCYVVICLPTKWSIKNVPLLFFEYSVKHWPILIIFGVRHHEETRSKWMLFWPPHFNIVATLPCEMEVTEPAVGEWCQRLSLAFMLEKEILSICCNKDVVMWHVLLFEMH